MTDFDWDKLGQTWQQAPRQPLPELKQLLVRRTRTIWWLTAADVVATIIGLVLLGWLLLEQPSTGATVFAIIAVLVLAACWHAVLKIRRGTWRLDSQSPLAMVDLGVRRARASIALARFNQLAVIIGAALGIGLRWFDTGNDFIPSIGSALAPLAIFAIKLAAAAVFALWIIGARVYEIRKRRELAELLELREELGED